MGTRISHGASSTNSTPNQGVELNSGAGTNIESRSRQGAMAGMPSSMALRTSNSSVVDRPRAKLLPHKTSVYQPNKGNPVDLNGKVKVDGDAVWCRDFSTMAVLAPRDEKRSDTLQRFSTPESIKAEVQRHGSVQEIRAKFKKMTLYASPHQKHFVANDQLGNLLCEFAKKIDQMSLE
jgi:hypothetical protein